MATGLSAYLANSFLDSLGNATSFSVSDVYVKLHTANPGSDGSANPALEITRKTATFSSATAGGLSSDLAITWSNIVGSEDATYFTAWDSATAGNFLFSEQSREIHTLLATPTQSLQVL